MHKPGKPGLCKSILLITFLAFSSFYFVACGSGDDPIHWAQKDEAEPDPEPVDTTTTPSVTILEESEVPDLDKYYKPAEFASMDMLRSDSKWSFVRSKQSDHFVVFWEEGFGLDPNADTIPATMKVDIDDLLVKAESFFDKNINTLGFAELGVGKSNLDTYKMEIYLLYQSEWLAVGSGYDDMIGALWVNPSTCQPVGSTIAHEIGHSFQYQVYADLIAYGGISNDYTRGYRYGFGGNGGNAFWEQCAQWQSFQSYPVEAFASYNFSVYMENYHRSVFHEWQRYASYWMHYYWADKHGIDEIGKLWREAESPEDPIETYMRLNSLSIEEMNAELYDAAAHFVTWDLDAIRDNGTNYIGKHTYKLFQLEDGSYQVAYSRCPGTSGYNVIPLNVPEAGTVVTTTFTGLLPGSALAANDPGEYSENGTTMTTTTYNNSSTTRAGWRYGYVALLESGERIYGEMNSATSTAAEITVPEGCAKLWFVVLGAPSSYESHAWDELESNDDQWPYKVKFSNTDILGNVTFEGNETPSDATLTFNKTFAVNADAYTGTSVTVDATELANAFVLQSSEISEKMGNAVTFYGVESDGTLNATTTANGYGHWFDADGNVCSWGEEAKLFSEYDASTFTFSIGQYPGHCVSGDQFTIKQALVYEYESGKSVQVTFVFNITLE